MSIICKIANVIKKRAKFNSVVNELSAYTDRELRDIGIDRSDIREIARQAVSDEGNGG